MHLKLLAAGILWAALLGPASYSLAAGLDLAVAKSKESGLPLLVIGATETCPYCVELEKRLTTEAELQPLVAQFVPIKLMVDDPEFAEFSRSYKPTGDGVPMIFIVGSDGKEIVNMSGAPQGDGLKQVLMTGIEKTGGMKKLPTAASVAGLMKADRVLRLAKKLLARDQKAAAIEALAPLLKRAKREEESVAASGADENGAPTAEANLAEKASPIEKNSELMQLAATLTQEGQTELAAAIRKSKAPDGALVAAVLQARVRRIYGGLPEISTALDEFDAAYEADAEKAPLLEQARRIDRAREFDERKSSIRAVAAYHQVIDEFPDTEAARLSELRVKQLSTRDNSLVSRPAETRTPDSRTWTDTTGAFKIDAVLEKVDGDVAVLLKGDGQTVRVPLSKLSESDRAFAESNR